MQRFGELLKKAREEKNITLEKASADTAINSRYLKALEDEETDIFPGEPYLVGFLRNYSTYLGLSPETIISLYRNKKIQTEPVPEGLIVKRKPEYFLPLILFIILAACTAVTLLIFFAVKKQKNVDDTIVVSKDMNTHSYTLGDKSLQIRVYKGDHIVIPETEGDIVLTVADTVSRFSLITPVGTQIVDLAEELELDVDGDAKKDLIVYVSDVSTAEVDRGAEVRFMVKHENPEVPSVDTENIPSIDEISSSEKPVVILEDTRAYPFTLKVSFRGTTLFRYKKDYDLSVEDFYTSGNIVTVTANNGLRLWMSNGSAMKIQLIADSKSFNLDIGKAGKVLVEDIKWIKDTDGKYKVVVIEVD